MKRKRKSTKWSTSPRSALTRPTSGSSICTASVSWMTRTLSSSPGGVLLKSCSRLFWVEDEKVTKWMQRKTWCGFSLWSVSSVRSMLTSTLKRQCSKFGLVLCSNCIHMECLALNFCLRVKGSAFKSLIQRCKKLTTLLLHHCGTSELFWKFVVFLWDCVVCRFRELYKSVRNTRGVGHFIRKKFFTFSQEEVVHRKNISGFVKFSEEREIEKWPTRYLTTKAKYFAAAIRYGGWHILLGEGWLWSLFG